MVLVFNVTFLTGRYPLRLIKLAFLAFIFDSLVVIGKKIWVMTIVVMMTVGHWVWVMVSRKKGKKCWAERGREKRKRRNKSERW